MVSTTTIARAVPSGDHVSGPRTGTQSRTSPSGYSTEGLVYPVNRTRGHAAPLTGLIKITSGVGSLFQTAIQPRCASDIGPCGGPAFHSVTDWLALFCAAAQSNRSAARAGVGVGEV